MEGGTTMILIKNCKYENTDLSSTKGTPVPMNFSAPDDD
jgi:hypothetical protein